MGLLGISSFRDMSASLFVSSVCSGLLAHTPTRSPRTRPANSLKHPLSHISEYSTTRSPFISVPIQPSDLETPQVAYKNSCSPHNVAVAGRRPAFYRKDIVSHILPCPHHRLPCRPWPLPRKKQTSPSSPPTCPRWSTTIHPGRCTGPRLIATRPSIHISKLSPARPPAESIFTQPAVPLTAAPLPIPFTPTHTLQWRTKS